MKKVSRKKKEKILREKTKKLATSCHREDANEKKEREFGDEYRRTSLNVTRRGRRTKERGESFPSKYDADGLPWKAGDRTPNLQGERKGEDQ